MALTQRMSNTMVKVAFALLGFSLGAAIIWLMQLSTAKNREFFHPASRGEKPPYPVPRIGNPLWHDRRVHFPAFN
jgi:hypothetical protein